MIRWTLRKRILFSFGLVTLVFVLISWIASTRLRTIGDIATSLRERGVPAAYAIGEIHAGAGFATTIGYVLASDPARKTEFAEKLRQQQSRIEPLFEQLAATNVTQTEKELFESFVAAFRTYQSQQKEAIEAAVDPARQRVVLYVLETRLQNAYLDVIEKGNAVIAFKKQQALDGTRQVEEQISAMKKRGLIAIGCVFLISALAAATLIRGITRPMKQVIDLADQMSTGNFTRRLTLERNDEFGQLGQSLNKMVDQLALLLRQVQKSQLQTNSSASQVAASAKREQATITQIAATTTEIGATSKEISATSRELLNTVNEVVHVAKETAAMAGNGQNGVFRLGETMKSVMDVSSSIGEKLEVLSSKAANINQVVTTIIKVANQTNLLSLNAAIEAEKAGEFGRGFSVVANEIRRLADETAVATENIELIVQEMQSAVSAGIMGMDKFAEEVRRAGSDVHHVSAELAKIIEQVQLLRPKFENVGEGMQAQTTGAQQISEALSQLSDVTKETSESLRQSNRVIVELTEAGDGLRGSVSQFKL